MAKRKGSPQFAICIHSDDPDLLTPRMIYKIIPDEQAAQSDYLRVVDNEGADYLYPATYFAIASFPEPVEKALSKLAPLGSPLRGRRLRSESKLKKTRIRT
ncbi:hypothetical protein FBQ87_13610 [Sphingobacteriales bacterium CHB3]|nr:hypothetical protein [Sphingobacteriales bacterium CHB3]